MWSFVVGGVLRGVDLSLLAGWEKDSEGRGRFLVAAGFVASGIEAVAFEAAGFGALEVLALCGDWFARCVVGVSDYLGLTTWV